MKISDKTAVLALIVSLTSAGFTVYQWRATDSEARTMAAIDISRKYLDDSRSAEQLANFRVERGATDASHRLLSHLNYIAYLANTDRIDGRYLAPQVTCDIHEVYNLFKERNTPVGIGFKYLEVAEIPKFLAHRVCVSDPRVRPLEGYTEKDIEPAK